MKTPLELKALLVSVPIHLHHKAQYVYLIGGEPAVERWVNDYELGVVK